MLNLIPEIARSIKVINQGQDITHVTHIEKISETVLTVLGIFIRDIEGGMSRDGCDDVP